MMTNDEIRARIAMLRQRVVKELELPGDYESDSELELDALEELLPDLEAIDVVALEFAGEPKLSAQQEAMLKEGIGEIRRSAVVGHIRNARRWVEVFGTDSVVRIEVFSKILGIEPNYESLDDATEEEEEMFEQQVSDMVAPIKKAIEEAK